jgi:hypothetical protein
MVSASFYELLLPLFSFFEVEDSIIWFSSKSCLLVDFLGLPVLNMSIVACVLRWAAILFGFPDMGSSYCLCRQYKSGVIRLSLLGIFEVI